MSEVQDLLNRHPEARIQVLVLWSPFMQRDSKVAAQRALPYISDKRVLHYWDLWRFGSRTYSAQLKIPQLEAWDMFVFYKPHIAWRDTPPEPTVWFQNRDLKVGTPYSKDALEKEIVTWLAK